jgi:hypothetical protein
MRCSICTGGGEVKDSPFSCGHGVLLCTKCSSKITGEAQCAECNHALFDEIGKEINDTATKEQAANPPPEKKTEIRTNTTPAMRSNFTTCGTTAMARFGAVEGDMRCDECGFYFCDCMKQSRII